MFNLARAIKAFEEKTGTSLPLVEFRNVLSLWWAEVGMPPEACFDEYLADLIAGFTRAKTALGTHVLDNACADVAPLSEKPTYKERVNRLLAVCRKLSKLSTDGTFFLGRRDAGELLGNNNPHFINNAIVALVATGALIEVTKGTAKGRRATRYKIGKPPA